MGLADLAQQMFDEGRRRWPEVRLQFEAFQTHCSRLFQDEVQEEDVVPFGAELYLCCACAQGDRLAQHAFQREFLAVARAAIERVCRDPEFLQDGLQELWEKMLVGPRAKVRDYSGRGPLAAWVRVAAARSALDRCRSLKLASVRRGELSEELASDALGPELTLTRARYSTLFRDALRHAVAALSLQQRSVLRMHVLGRCSIDQIGRAYDVHRATAARWLEQARGRIYDHTRRELSVQNSRMTESEFKSLARALGSELDFNFSEAPSGSPSAPGKSAPSTRNE